MKKFRGFTLAEVLLTLTIVGVVAAMTMPVLINKISDKVLETQRKKAQAVLANGIDLMFAHGKVDYYRQTRLAKCERIDCIAAEIKKEFKVAEDSLTSKDISEGAYTIDDEEFNVWQDSKFAYLFKTPDGITYGLLEPDKEFDGLVVVADINGTKGPNKGGKDLCTFKFGTQGEIASSTTSCGLDGYEVNRCSVNNLAACDAASCNALVSTEAGCSYTYQFMMCRQGDPNCKPGAGECKKTCFAVKDKKISK